MPSSAIRANAFWCAVIVVALFAAEKAGMSQTMAEKPATPALDALVSDFDGQRNTIRLPADDGRIAKADFLAALGQVANLDLHAADRLLPHGELDLNSATLPRRLAMANRLMRHYVESRIERDPHNNEPVLVIEIDRQKLESVRRRAKSRIRQVSLQVLDPRGTLQAKTHYGLRLDEAAVERPNDRLVVAIHGFNGSAHSNDAFLDALRQSGFACASFAYPNDQAIADSARLLSKELKLLAAREPKRRLAIVAFSMGGLVARAAIEDPQLDPQNVERLIMIAPPNQGTVWARFACGLDLYEHLEHKTLFEPRALVAASILDGLGEARKDLCPGSTFLRQLNARERRQGVQYSIISGEGFELPRNSIERLNSLIATVERKSTVAGLFRPQLDRLRDELQELCEPGDGLVSVRRSQLPGVNDLEVLRFGHLERFDDPHDGRTKLVHVAIANRLN